MTVSKHDAPLPTDLVGQYLGAIGQIDLLTAEQEVFLAKEIEGGKAAIERLDTETGLTRAEKIRLRSFVRRGEDARQRFITANLRLVVANAKRYAATSSMDLLDLVQEGNLGLLRAVEKFDWRKGFKFSTYATWWIRQAIARAIADKSRNIRVPVHLHDAARTVRNAQSALRLAHGRRPTIKELANETGLEPDQVEAALRVSNTISLETPVGEDDAQLGDFIEDADAVSPLDLAADIDVARRLRMILCHLPEREARILALRYGFIDGSPRTLEEVGQEFGLTRERIRQLEKLALARLRHPASALDEKAFVG